MLTLVANTIQFFVFIIQSVFVTTSYTGQIIFNVITFFTSTILSVLEGIISFIQIIYEDNIFIFTDELPNLASDIAVIVTDQILYLKNTLAYFKIDAALAKICWFLKALSTIVVEVFCLLKRTLILFGNTIWFILTFIPVQVPFLLKKLSDYILECIKSWILNAYRGLLKVTEFLTDVPLESFIGITSAIIIVRLYVHYKEFIHSQATVLYWSLVRKVLYLYYALHNYFTDSDGRMIARMSPNEQLEVSHNDILEDDGADALCVICQERQKCVLTLPCRHVCLCRECCVRLYGYQRTCPMCRTFIYHSVNIYL